MDFIRKNYIPVLLLIPVISFVMHLHVFKLDLVGIHVWRQTQTQTVINNFYKGNSPDILHPQYNDLNKQEERMEFPLMQWTFAQFHKVFGADVAVSRILTFIIGLLSVLGMFVLADTIFKDKLAATVCAWAFNWSPVFYYYTVNPLPDNFALCCGIWSAAFFFRYIYQRSLLHLIFSAAFLSLATLAKLPFVLYGSIAIGYFIVQLRKSELILTEALKAIVIYVIALSVPATWYIAVIPSWQGNGVVKGVLENTGSLGSIVDILVGQLVSILPELLINYGAVLFFIAGFYFIFKHKMYRSKYFPVFVIWLLSIIAYFLFEINMITLVHDYYLFPFLPIIFLLVAYGAEQILVRPFKFLQYLSIILLILLPLTAYLRIDSRWDTQQPGFNPVYYHNKAVLRNLIPKDAKCIVGNDESHFITLYYLDRKGWTFSNDWLEEGQLKHYIANGAGYFVSDSDIDKQENIQPYLGEKIFEEGTLRVYKLKRI